MAVTPTTWNPSDKSADITLSNGDLTAKSTSNGHAGARTIISKTSGKWYWEITIDYDLGLLGSIVGLGVISSSLSGALGSGASDYAYRSGGKKGNSNSWVPYGDSWTTGDIIGIAIDLDAGKIWFSKNGVWQASGDPAAGTGEAYSGIANTMFGMFSLYYTDEQLTANFGASAFSYSVPSGFTSGFGGVATTSIIDLSSEVKASEEIISDFLTSITVGLESLIDLNLEIIVGGTSIIDLKSDISADFLTNFADLSSDISTGAQVLKDLYAEIQTGHVSQIDLLSEISSKAQIISDLSTEIRVITYPVYNLNTEITVLRSKWWLNTEIKVGCSAKWNFNTEWNPNRFLNTEIEVKKPYAFSFTTQTGVDYSITNPEVELLIPGYSWPIRTLFLDYLPVGNTNEYSLQFWWARGLYGRNTLKNVKIQAQYINTSDSGGYEVVTCDWLSCKVGSGIYQTVNETPLVLGDILCDSKLDITLRVECRDCSLTRGLVFFRLVFTGDYNEAVYGGTVVYRDGGIYHAGLYDDYQSNAFICRMLVVE